MKKNVKIVSSKEQEEGSGTLSSSLSRFETVGRNGQGPGRSRRIPPKPSLAETEGDEISNDDAE